MLVIQLDDNALWMAPYAYAIVILGFLFFLFRVFENWYSDTYDRPLFRHYMVFKKLSEEQQGILEHNFSFFGRLSKKHKRQFEHRVATFVSEKTFVGRDTLVVTDKMKVLIGAVGCMLSFGRKNYNYGLIEYILVYPDVFYSAMNGAYHKGEFNPREKALVLSWKDFAEGYKITDDKLNLGIHEFMHAMQLEAKQSSDVDSSRLTKHFQEILKELTNQEVKDKLDKTQFFRAYAFTNQYEFLAVIAEYFIEAPKDFQSHFPKLYGHTKKLLNFTYGGY